MTTKDRGRDRWRGDATPKTTDSRNHTQHGTDKRVPAVSGQCAYVLELIRTRQPLLSFVLTADHAIPEAAARVHDLRCMGWNIITRIVPSVKFRGRIRRNAALYSLGVPEWPYPGFVTGKEGGGNVE